MTPIALFGLSGVGKTTLAHALVDSNPRFCVIPITTSRASRADDNPQFVEFLSKTEFLSAVSKKHFPISWEQDGNHYGYRVQHFENTQIHPILTCSLSAIEQVKNYGALTVLVIGNSTEGLRARGSEEVMKKRIELNEKNTILYLNQPWFRNNVDIEHKQVWGNIAASVQALYESITVHLKN